MNKTQITTAVLLWLTITVSAQFHTLNYPKISPKVVESQKLGVTKITIAYSSPALRGRDVWNDEIPKKGDHIAWRAGANLATTIEFTTDVKIEGQELKAGIYAFYVIPDNDTHTLLFAHNYQQWGSYYLDIEKDISLKVEVNSVSCVKSEQLDFEFLNRTENSLIIGLEWDDKRIPFKIEVDLNKTVIESFRKELRGINTNRWEAWDDAARWCLNHDTNLEEALEWVNRSINGGYNGFSSNKNLANLETKMNILKKLNRMTEFNSAKEEAKQLHATESKAYDFGGFLLRNNYFQDAYDYSNSKLKQYPNSWILQLNKSRSQYFLGKVKAAIKDMNKTLKLAPNRYHKRLNEIINEIEAGTYKL